MKRRYLLILAIVFSASIPFKWALAVCPVCTIAVGAGVGLSRWLGIDDLITGAWVGGLLVSVSIWTSSWMDKKGYNFKFRGAVVTAAYYLITIIPLYYTGIMGHPYNQFWGIDKLLFGIICGSLVFLFSTWLHNFLKNENGGKSYFPYQKVAIPVSALIILSGILFLVIKL